MFTDLSYSISIVVVFTWPCNVIGNYGILIKYVAHVSMGTGLGYFNFFSVRAFAKTLWQKNMKIPITYFNTPKHEHATQKYS